MQIHYDEVHITIKCKCKKNKSLQTKNKWENGSVCSLRSTATPELPTENLMSDQMSADVISYHF